VGQFHASARRTRRTPQRRVSPNSSDRSIRSNITEQPKESDRSRSPRAAIPETAESAMMAIDRRLRRLQDRFAPKENDEGLSRGMPLV
jgi:hypothetical protein